MSNPSLHIEATSVRNLILALWFQSVTCAAIDLIGKNKKEYKKENLAVVDGGDEKDASEVVAKLKSLRTDFIHVFEGQISPALVVHTGPGLIGIAAQGM